MHADRRLFPRKVMRMYAGPPVDLSDLAEQPQTPAVLRDATARIMAAVTTLLEEVRGEAAPLHRYDPRQHGVADIGNPHDPRNRYTPKPAPTPKEGESA